MELKAILETILFVHGAPVSLDQLVKTVRLEPDAVAAALQELGEEYRERGLALLEKDGSYQLGSNPANASYIADLVKSEFSEELSRAALETVAIIAYRGPVTRSQIEYARGVNSSFTLRNLLMRGLVERIENPNDARSWLYRVSFDFLRHLGLAAVEELPDYAELRAQKIEVLEEGSPPPAPIHA